MDLGYLRDMFDNVVAMAPFGVFSTPVFGAGDVKTEASIDPVVDYERLAVLAETVPDDPTDLDTVDDYFHALHKALRMDLRVSHDEQGAPITKGQEITFNDPVVSAQLEGIFREFFSEGDWQTKKQVLDIWRNVIPKEFAIVKSGDVPHVLQSICCEFMKSLDDSSDVWHKSAKRPSGLEGFTRRSQGILRIESLETIRSRVASNSQDVTHGKQTVPEFT